MTYRFRKDNNIMKLITKIFLWPLTPIFRWLEKRELDKIMREIEDEPPLIDPFDDEHYFN